MTYSEFVHACHEGSLPESATKLLRSLYEDRRGEWSTAHAIAQEIRTPDGSLVHAYLHREEGDLGNANYWYSRAGASAPSTGLDDEWEALAHRFTSEP